MSNIFNHVSEKIHIKTGIKPEIQGAIGLFILLWGSIATAGIITTNSSPEDSPSETSQPAHEMPEPSLDRH